MPPSKTQAQKKAEADEKNARIAAEREAERLERAEHNKRQALEAEALKASKAEKKDKKKEKKKVAAAAPAPLMPSIHDIAHAVPDEHKQQMMMRDAPGDDGEEDGQLDSSLAAQLNSLSTDPAVASAAAASSSSSPSSASSPSGARVIFNHSTYLEQLQPFVAKLRKVAVIKTVHPGALSQHAANCEEFGVVFQSASNDGGLNYVAKKGSGRQDLRITPVKGATQTMVDEAIDSILHPIADADDEEATGSDLLAPNSNRLAAELAKQAGRVQAREQHAELKNKEQQAKHSKKVAEKAKKLKAAIGNKNEAVQALAEKWVEWEK